MARLAELDGLPGAAAGDSEAMPRRTTEFVADLVEPAKAAALDKLDEGSGRSASPPGGYGRRWRRPARQRRQHHRRS
jgi:hypothetical protein